MKNVENNVKYVKILTFGENFYKKMRNLSKCLSLGRGFCKKFCPEGTAFEREI